MNLLYTKATGLFLLLFAVAASISAEAQDSTVTLRFVSFPKAANAEPIELLLREEKTVAVEIPTNSISQTYQVPALAIWTLGKSSTDAEGKPIFQVLGKVQSSGASEQLILAVRKGSVDSDGLELTAVKNNGEGFGGGKYLLLNATSVDIAGAIGTAKFSLKPNAHALLAPQPTRTEGDRKYCFAEFYFRHAEKIQPFSSSTWRYNEKARSMVFFYHDPKTKQLRIHTIRSFAS
jgi:hypothetical protein